MSTTAPFVTQGHDQGLLSATSLPLRDALATVRRQVGMVFQENFLFSNTIAANIAFGHPDATQERIERAARIAGAHTFIMALPEGYETFLGERGTRAVMVMANQLDTTLGADGRPLERSILEITRRVEALSALLGSEDGKNLLAGYRRFRQDHWPEAKAELKMNKKVCC